MSVLLDDLLSCLDRTVLQNPKDCTPRLVYADALEEAHGGETENSVAVRRQAMYSLQSGLPLEIDLKLPGDVPMTFCLVPPGEFTMGSDAPEASEDEKPAHLVEMPRPFYMGKYQVTQEQWLAVTGHKPSRFDGPRRPVERVSWNDCVEFATKATGMVRDQLKKLFPDLGDKLRLRLPTEEEWEYAARAGTTTHFPWGNELNGTQANVDGSMPFGTSVKGPCLGETCDVGRYAPNNWGMHDNIGNVWEWCIDPYDAEAYKKKVAAREREGEQGRPFRDTPHFEGGPTSARPDSARPSSGTTGTPTESPSSSAFASSSEGEQRDPFADRSEEEAGSFTNHLPSPPEGLLPSLQWPATAAGGFASSSEGEEGHPFGQSEAVLGSTSPGTAVRPDATAPPADGPPATTAFASASEGEDRRPFTPAYAAPRSTSEGWTAGAPFASRPVAGPAGTTLASAQSSEGDAGYGPEAILRGCCWFKSCHVASSFVRGHCPTDPFVLQFAANSFSFGLRLCVGM